eukprot:358784-Chlamydomonas_euryale.AAC.13
MCPERDAKPVHQPWQAPTKSSGGGGNSTRVSQLSPKKYGRQAHTGAPAMSMHKPLPLQWTPWQGPGGALQSKSPCPSEH